MISYQNSVLFAGESLNNTPWRERYGQMAPKTAEEALDQLIKLPKEVVAPQISDEQLRQIIKGVRDKSTPAAVRGIFAEFGIKTSIECPMERRPELVERLNKLAS